MPRIDGKKLTGPQLSELSAALRTAFKPMARLNLMLNFRLERDLQDFTGNNAYDIAVFDLLQAAEAEAWTADLVLAARRSNPENPELIEFAWKVGFAPAIDLQSRGIDCTGLFEEARDRGLKHTLERVVKPNLPYLDPEAFRQRLCEVEGQVCRVEVTTNKGKVYGTGFLVNADVVVTNYHVMEPVILGERGQATKSGIQARRGGVTLRFDYKMMGNGAILNEGTPFALVPGNDWLLDESQYSKVDLEVDPKSGDPGADELDYALLRLDTPAGNRKVGGANAESQAPDRGWIRAKARRGDGDEDFTEGKPVFIAQHPHTRPLKVVLDMESMIGLNGNGTRVRYRANTDNGSSGSPCFNAAWDLVALHHCGDPNYEAFHMAEYNQGIPFAAILALLEKRGKVDLLS